MAQNQATSSVPTPSTDILSDETIMNLAGQVPPDQLHRLGVALGFTYTEVECIWVERLKNTAMAATEILMAWKTKHGAGHEQAEKLRAILDSVTAEVITLAVAGESVSRPVAQGIEPAPTTAAVTSTTMLGEFEQVEIAPNFTIVDCREKLAQRYKTGICRVRLRPWDKTSFADVKDIYTVVTMYKKDAAGNNLGEQDKITLEGSVNDIFSTEVRGLLPTRIVIYAAAGKGKTTAVAKMAYDWAHRVQGSPIKDLPLLFILKLRNLTKEQSLGQAIKMELLPDLLDLKAEDLERFIRNNQNKCSLILDGLDEYSGSISSDDTSNIITVLTNRQLVDSRVVVTSRPHVEKDFQRSDLARVYARMEIEGFSQENVENYIDKLFSTNLLSGHDLKQFLTNNDLLNELVTTPLFCLMACTLWDQPGNLLFGIKTQTGLFEATIRFLWFQIREMSEMYTEAWLGETKKRLGKIALKGLVDDSDKLLFTHDDFKKHPESLTNGLKLGIISESGTDATSNPLLQSQTVARKIEFIHKSCQEYLAGKYLSDRYKKTNRVAKIVRLTELDSLVRNKRKCIGDYENLLRFAAGSDQETCLKAMSAILSSHNLEDTNKFRIIMDLSTEAQDLGNVSGVLNRCIQTESVVLTSPTVYTAVGMKALPDVLKKKIHRITLKDTKLDEALSLKLRGSCFQSFTSLQEITLRSLRIDEESLVRWVEASRAVSTMQVIYIGYCGVAENGRLHTHLTRLDQPRAQGGLAVHVYESGKFYKFFDIPRTH